MSKVVGIDLGTTNSLVAYVKDGVPVVIRDLANLSVERNALRKDTTSTSGGGFVAKNDIKAVLPVHGPPCQSA